MGKLVSKPNKHVTEAMGQKTAALKLMSMDMSSAAKQPFRMWMPIEHRVWKEIPDPDYWEMTQAPCNGPDSKN